VAHFLFGSGLNAAGEATGRISGVVMLCLPAGCWPRAGESGRRQALVPLIALSWLAAAFLVVTGLIGANVGVVALACRRASSHFGGLGDADTGERTCDVII
jgi:hypothetical protein